jgi:hypothetical protein
MEKKSPRTTTLFEKEQLIEDVKHKRMQTILENDEKQRIYHHNKIEKSSPIFANTKVTSCSSVLMSNGLTVCIPFRSGSSFRG